MAESSKALSSLHVTGRHLKIILVLTIVVLLNLSGGWLAHQIHFQLFPRHDAMLQTIVLVAVLVYILLMATPFMPGIEIGLALLLLLGSKGAVLVYFCTLIALSISFALGRTLPSHLLARFLDWLYLHRAAGLVDQLVPLDYQQRLELLNRRMPSRIAPLLLRHRFLMIGVALNLPGNALIGGGGGIAMVAGLSKIIPFTGFVILLALAIAPVPLWFFLQG